MSIIFNTAEANSASGATVTTGTSGAGLAGTAASGTNFPAGMTCQYHNSAAYNGLFGYRFVFPSTASEGFIQWTAPVSQAGRYGVAYQYRHSAVPTVAERLGSIRSTSAQLMGMSIDSTGHLFARSATDGDLGSHSSTILAVDTWYHIEYFVTPGTTTSDGRIEYYLYNAAGTTLLDSFDSGATVNAGTTNVDKVWIGRNDLVTQARTTDYDDIQFGDVASGTIGMLETIALRAAGTATAANASVSAVDPAVPAGTTTGDLSVLTVSAKPYSTVITTPDTWTKIGEHTNGTTASGTDTGSTLVAVYVKEGATPGAIGALSQTNANSMSAVIHSYMKPSTKAWNHSAFVVGADTSQGANFDATADAGFTAAQGDVVSASVAVNGDIGTVTAQAIGGMSGATLSTATARTNAAITTGNDSRIIVADTVVRLGSSSAAPTYTHTNASNSSGTAIWLKLGLANPTASPAGIASTEAFGTVVVSSTLTASPGGIATAEAFGTATVNTTATVSPDAIASAETLGDPVVTATLTASPTAIDSQEAFGTAAVATTLTSSPAEISSGEAFGTAAVTATLTASPTGIATDEASGTPAVTATLTVTADGIATGEAFGAPVVTITGGETTVSPGAIDTAETFGTASVSTILTVSPGDTATAETFGSPTVSATLGTAPGGIASTEVFGTASIGSILVVTATGIASDGALGTPAVSISIPISPGGIGSAEALGSPTLTTSLTASPSGVASSETFGTAWAFGSLTSSPPSIATGEAFGTPTVTATLTMYASGIGAPFDNFGSPTLSGAVQENFTVSPTGIPGAAAFGNPTVTTSAPVFPAGVASREAFGSPRISTILVLQANDILPQAAFGTPVLKHGWHMSPTGVASPSAIGTPTLSQRLTLTIVGIPAPDPQFGNPKLAGSLVHFENVILGTLAPRRKAGKLDAPLTDADRGASRWRGTL